MTLHKIYFYRDRNGNEPVVEYMAELAAKREFADIKERWAKNE